jgi:predicted nucleic acid-binding protein
MVILDTSVIIDHLRQKTKNSLLRRLAVKYQNQMAVSVITLQELYEGQSTRDQVKENHMLSILTPLKILPYTEEVAKLAGILGRDNQGSADLADLAIAATAIVYKTPLATINIKHFTSLKGLDLTPQD